MSSNAFTEKEQRVQEGAPPPGSLPLQPGEQAPSLLREDDATLARVFGMIGAALVLFGGLALGFNLAGRPPRIGIGTGLSMLTMTLGLAGMLFHAAFDNDRQFRLAYMALGFVAILGGVACALLPYPDKVGNQFAWAVPLFLLGLLFFVAFLRNETDRSIRDVTQIGMLGTGGLMTIVGLVGGNLRGEFLLPYGLVLAVLGLLYLGSFVGTRGISDDLGYGAGLGIVGVGAFLLLVAVIRSFIGTSTGSYFMPHGFVQLLVAGAFLATGAGLCSDVPLVVLLRRELGGFFYSPIAYLTLLAFAFFTWWAYLHFIDLLLPNNPRSQGLTEPIIRNFIIAIVPVLTIVAVVPALTMRLLSEEHRSGTLEVLMTAPVDEVVVVGAKFLAAFLTYLLMWVPFGLYLLAIPLSGGNPFDYRPLFSFLVGLSVTGAGFISMGLFFSSLTKNQIASFLLTLVGMMGLTYCYFAAFDARPESATEIILTQMSYIHIWNSTLEGKIVPRLLLFYLSSTVLWLFLTVKVLESRKWR
jgi:ABC-2 type transport system permease protein